MLSVVLLITRGSLPRMRGEDSMHQNAKWARCSVPDRPPTCRAASKCSSISMSSAAFLLYSCICTVFRSCVHAPTLPQRLLVMYSPGWHPLMCSGHSWTMPYGYIPSSPTTSMSGSLKPPVHAHVTGKHRDGCCTEACMLHSTLSGGSPLHCEQLPVPGPACSCSSSTALTALMTGCRKLGSLRCLACGSSQAAPT
jgi:hypothetical protein